MVSKRLLLRVGAGRLQAELISRGQVIWAAETDFGSSDELEEAIATLAGELPSGQRARADVVLLPPMLQLRHLRGIPPVRSQRALDGIVASQSSRFFRRNGHPLVTSARRLQRPAWFRKTADTCVAAAVEQPWLDAIGAGLGAAGLGEGRIGVEGSKQGPTFRSGNAILMHAKRVRRQMIVLSWVAVALWCAAAGVLALRVHRTKSDLATGIAQLREPASAALAARRAVAQAQEALDSVASARDLTRRVLATMAALSQAVPDSAFLTSLDWSAAGRDLGSGTVTGAARHAVAVVAALEQAGFSRPRLEGAPVGDQSGPEPRERFVLRFGPAEGGR
jgi:hypothetical protein